MKRPEKFSRILQRSMKNHSPDIRKSELIFGGLSLLLLAATPISVRNFFALTDAIDNAIPIQKTSKRDNSGEVRYLDIKTKYEALKKLQSDTPKLLSVAENAATTPVITFDSSKLLLQDAILFENAPTITIIGVAIFGKETICTLDIDGEGRGLIFKKGMLFGDGRGKIISIDSKGVSWNWLGKNHRTDL